MKRLWKTKLPAFLLAMVMVIGMIPAAAAARTDISYDVASGKEVELVRSKSQNKNGVWATWWGEMAKKACLKRLFKKMRNTPSMQEAVNIDNESFKINENIIDAAPHAGVKKSIAALSEPIAALSAPKVEERSQTVELTHEKVSEPVVAEEPLPFE